MNLLPILTTIMILQRRPSNCMSSCLVVEGFAMIFLVKSSISVIFWSGMETVPRSQSMLNPRAQMVRPGGEMWPGVVLRVMLQAS